MRTWALACVLPALACAKPGAVAGPADVADSPSWSSADGRDQVRLDIARAMVEAGTPESALKVVGEMRADGQSGVELDVLQARALREIGLYEDAAELLERTLRRHPRNRQRRACGEHHPAARDCQHYKRAVALCGTRRKTTTNNS